MEEVAGWIAPIATMTAAIMTAANLGTRVTGWGFVVFTIGAAGWCVEAILTHQSNLLWSNAFLGVVDLIGIYRWLGQRAKLEDGAHSAVEKSRSNKTPLFPVLSLEGQPIESKDGTPLAHVVGAMAECASGKIAYLVIRCDGSIGAGTTYRALSWDDLQPGEKFRTRLSLAEIQQLAPVEPGDWPDREPQAVKKAAR